MTNTEAPKFLEPESPDRVSCYYWIFVDNNGELHLEDLRRTLINGQEPKTNPQQTSEIRMHSFPVNQEGNGKYVWVLSR